MSAREWKPGDVAMVVDPVGGKRVMVHIGHDPASRCWHGAEANGDLRCLDADQAIGARPLVVIDPESDDDVRLLCEAYRSVDHGVGTMPMQAALRSLIEPPKPDEVYEHYTPTSPNPIAARAVAICGKVWRPNAANTVSIGKCPECAETIEAGWTK